MAAVGGKGFGRLLSSRTRAISRPQQNPCEIRFALPGDRQYGEPLFRRQVAFRSALAVRARQERRGRRQKHAGRAKPGASIELTGTPQPPLVLLPLTPVEPVVADPLVLQRMSGMFWPLGKQAYIDFLYACQGFASEVIGVTDEFND